MSEPRPIEPRLIFGLSEIAPDHDALICDIWGVVHNGQAPFPEAVEALRRFRQGRGRVVLLSNAPRMPDAVEEQFRRIGVATDFYDAIVTSGAATREDLIRRGPLSLYYIGTDWDLTLLTGLSVTRTSIEDADLAVCIGLRDDLTESPDDYAGILAEMRARNLLMLCANPDLKVYRGKQLCWCAGALAKAYEKIGGKVTYYGKPYPAIYQAALKAAGNPRTRWRSAMPWSPTLRARRTPESRHYSSPTACMARRSSLIPHVISAKCSPSIVSAPKHHAGSQMVSIYYEDLKVGQSASIENTVTERRPGLR